jgi:TRAP-type C4-dicarboxylate transport system substrate-binding protein
MKTRGLALSLILAAAVAAPASSQVLTLKVASFAPANSPWELGLKRLAVDFDRLSEGRVRLAFPQSLRASKESDIIQKMRLGVDGALLSTMGIAELYPDTLALSMPSLIRSDAELEAVFQAVTPVVRERLSDRYAVLAIAKGGWIRYFSTAPIVYPRDLRKFRMSTSPDDEKIATLLQSLGARTVKGGMSALALQLNSNAVDSFYLSPILAAMLWSQLQGRIGYMSPFKVAPFFGAIVFAKASWDRVPADLKPRLEEAVRAMAAGTAAETEKLEEASIASLRTAGLRIPAYPDDAEAEWSAVYAGMREGIVAGMFSKGFLEIIDASLAKARKGRGVASALLIMR